LSHSYDRVVPTTLGCFVVGMHRSGTSYVAGLCRLAGLERLRGDDIDRVENNPHGHEEIRQLVWVNQEVLKSLGGGWSAVDLEPPVDLEAVPGDLRARARDWLAARTPDTSWFWKDPRSSVTLPLWLEALSPSTRPVVAFVYRHPEAVASSLERRDGLAQPAGVALWEAYTRHALVAMRGLPVVVLDYDHALEHPWSAVQTVRSWLEGLDPVLRPPADEAAVQRWADRGARHHAAAPSAPGWLSPAQASLYGALQALPRHCDRFEPPELPPVTPWAAAVLDQRRQQAQARRRLARSRAARWHRRAGRWAKGSVRRVRS
jgi:hypothetical protein